MVDVEQFARSNAGKTVKFRQTFKGIKNLAGTYQCLVVGWSIHKDVFGFTKHSVLVKPLRPFKRVLKGPLEGSAWHHTLFTKVDKSEIIALHINAFVR